MNIKRLKSSELSSAVCGMVLGDGCIRRKQKEQNYQFLMTHSIKQKEYALWKKSILDQISSTKTYIYEYVNTKYPQITVSTNTRRYFTKLAKLFYTEDRKKILTVEVLNKLTPLGLAIWYMDDGTLNFHKDGTFSNCEIATCGFSLEENELIQKWFKDKYKLESTIRVRKNKYYSIAFSAKNYESFLDIIREYIPSCMAYKVNRKTISNN